MGVQPSLRQIGKYAVLDVIGTGGMGIVYKAHDPSIGRDVAIKMLRQSDAAAGGVFDRFFSREMKSTGNLNHKNIVIVFDSGVQDGTPYLVMEYLQGEPASKIIAERRAMPLVEKLDLVIQVCDGLQYAHDRNIIHRDVKPANVIVLGDGTAKIVDFGVARIAGSESSIVQTGHLVGSLSYMSPEQINSIPIDARSDIFSTGVMLYELLTFELPFKGHDAASTFVKILREEPVPLSHFGPDFPPGLQSVVSRALAKNVNDRYQTAEEFGFELLSVQKDLKAASIADCMKRADAAMHRRDLERAMVHLQEVIRLDRQNERANRLLRDVRKVIQQQQRQSQIVQMRSQAQVALAGAQYEEALACADQALRLDPNDTESIQLREEIRATISRVKAVREALNRAEASLFAGDFDEAKEAVEESLRLDPTDSEARALASVINKELAERSRRARVQVFVDQARKGIAERKFNEAIDALHQAEELDPSDSNVHELLQWALRGQEQEKKRRFLQDITEQIEKALHAGDFSSACTISEMGLQRFPEEATLLRLRAISEKQREIAERRRFVNEQSLTVKGLVDQGKHEEAIQLLNSALRKFPAEPNLESLLANTQADVERRNFERAEAERQQAVQRAEAEARGRLNQQVLGRSAELKQLLDARADLSEINRTAAELRTALEGRYVEDHAKQVAAPVLREAEARIRSRDQALQELDHVRRVIERPHDTAALSEADDRLRSIKATFPNERNIRDICAELGASLARLREKRDQNIGILTGLAEGLDATPTSQLTEVFRRARDIATGFVGDARVGALLQQIESSVKQRLDQHAERMRDLTALAEDLGEVTSLDELARALEHGKSIAAMDPTDRELANVSARFEGDAARVRGLMESLLADMRRLGQSLAAAATVHEAEALVPEVKALAERRSNFQELQEAAKRIHAEVQGRRIEHDLIIQELESVRSSVPILESNEELQAAAARASQCREEHRYDRTILTVCADIEHEVARIIHDRAELQARIAECDSAMRSAEHQSHQGDLDAALAILESVTTRNPDRTDLHLQIKMVHLAIDERRAEQERVEQERIAQEKAEADERARREAAKKAIGEAWQLLAQGEEEKSLGCLRTALERDPDNQELHSTLELVQADVVQRRAERERREHERMERERMAREQAEAEARARKQAADRAIQEASDLLNQGQEDASLACIHAALEHDPDNFDLRIILELTQGEVSHRRAERERLERERIERERIAREKAEAEARARGEAAEWAIQECRSLLDSGQEDASLQCLRAALERDPERQDLQSTMEWLQREIPRRRDERKRLERERIERERIAREKAEAEARTRKEAAERALKQARQLLEQGQEDESVDCLRLAVERDPANTALHSTQKSLLEEVSRRRAERERIAREKAEADARARKEAADQAIEQARQLLEQGQEDESLACLHSAVERDPASADLESRLKSLRAEIERRRAERERLERERIERERIAKEKAEADARVRKAAAEQAMRRARSLLAQGKEEEATEILRSALVRDADNQQLQSALEMAQAEAARIRSDRERQEQERLEKERIAREKAEAEEAARKQAADAAIREARELLAQGQGDEAVKRLGAELQRDAKSSDLRSALDSIQAELARQRAEQERLERERLERERIAQQKAEAEARARKVAAEQAIKDARGLLGKNRGDEALERLRAAFERDPENSELASALASMQAEVALLRAEQERMERERLERERIAREKAEAEARARQQAAELAIKEAREMLAEGRGEDSVQRLRTALQQDAQNTDLRKALDSTQAEISRRRAEQERLERERLERERLERERIAKEKAEAEALARRKAAEQAIKEAAQLQTQGRIEDAAQRLTTALERDPDSAPLKSALQKTQAEIARQRAEKERLEREQRERERIAREKAEAEERARVAAAEQALQKARKLLAKGSAAEALQILGAALERDPKNKDLQAARNSAQTEIDRQRAERERLERERAEKEQSVLRARKAEIDEVLKQARKLQADGNPQEALQQLRKSLKRYPDSQELRAAVDAAQAEIKQLAAKQRAAQAQPKTAEADQTRVFPATKSAAQKAVPAEEVSAEARRQRMILIGILAGAAILLPAIGFVVWRILTPSTTPVTFNLDPTDGMLTVDGKPDDCRRNCPLSAGVHTLKLEKPGYESASVIAGPHFEQSYTLHLRPIPSALISVHTDIAQASSVTVDGKDTQELTAQKAVSTRLVAGPHHLQVSGKDGTVDVSIQVGSDGMVQAVEASGLDETPVVALTQNGDHQEIFCRCDGAEIQIDGKKVKTAHDNRYKVAGKGTSDHEVILSQNGQPEPFPLSAADANSGTVFIGSGKADPAWQEWEKIKNSRDIAVLLKFKTDHPQSAYARVAYERAADVKWESIQASTNAEDFNGYLTQFKDTKHTHEADLRSKEEMAWDGLDKKNEEALNAFINSNGNSRHVPEARRLIDVIEAGKHPAVPDDEAEWNRIKGTRDLNAFLNFVKKYPGSKHFAEANERIPEMAWDDARNSRDLNKLKKFREDYPTSKFASPAFELMAQVEWGNLQNSTDLNALKEFHTQYRGTQFEQPANERMAEVAWDHIHDSVQLPDFESFVKDYPGTRHIPEANDRIKRANGTFIKAVLETYRSAYEKKDLRTLSSVWPNPPDFFSLQFRTYDKIHVTLSCQSDPQITGDIATVSCMQKVEFTSQGRTTPEAKVREFKLKRDQDKWVIEKGN